MSWHSKKACIQVAMPDGSTFLAARDVIGFLPPQSEGRTSIDGTSCSTAEFMDILDQADSAHRVEQAAAYEIAKQEAQRCVLSL